MSKGFDLRQAVTDAVSTAPTDLTKFRDPPAQAPAPAAPPARARARAKPEGPRGAAREGARGVTVYLLPEAFEDLKIMGLRMKETTQDLVEGAVLDMIAKHKKREGRS